MITCFFGPPGCGKSSCLSYIVQKELKRISKGKSKYKAVYTNYHCNGAIKISFDDLGQFYYHDCLIVLDELTLSADSRDFKSFSKYAREFITLHRHFNVDIIYSVQDWSRADKTIRVNTINLYYVTNMWLFSIARPIYRTININEMVSELIMGYRFPKFRELIRGMKIFPIFKVWKFYDSYDKYGFDLLPAPPSDQWGISSASQDAEEIDIDIL